MSSEYLYISLYSDGKAQEAVPKAVKNRALGYFYDVETGIGVIKRRIEADLREGFIYEFSFSDYDDGEFEDTYYEAVLKRDGNIYYIAEYYNNDFYKTSPECLGDVWLHCNVKDELGIDLSKIVVHNKECKLCSGGYNFRMVQVSDTLMGVGISFTPNCNYVDELTRFNYCPMCGRELINSDFKMEA